MFSDLAALISISNCCHSTPSAIPRSKAG